MQQDITKFSSIIFDLGGVILNIDPYKTVEEMRKLGLEDFDAVYAHLKQTRTLDDLEKGLITPEVFLNQIKRDSAKPLSDDQILKAWNALLLDFPEERIRLVKRLKDHPRFKTYLLSNTNAIHYQVYTRMLQERYDIDGLETLFDKTYFSHKLHMRKPDLEIYEHVLKVSGVEASKTLFVDDSEANVKAARKAGLNAFHLKAGTTINDLFPEQLTAR